MMLVNLLILLVVLLSPAGPCAQAQDKPEIRENNIDIGVWDFGRVREGQLLRHKFLLKNNSSQALNIKDILTSCGCAVSRAEKKNLLPGEATLVEVRFNTKGYSGSVQQYVYIRTDSLDKPILRLIIKAEVK